MGTIRAPEKEIAVKIVMSEWFYSFSKNSHAEHEMYIPPGMLRSRSFTRFTMRVGLPHLGQSVLLVVSMTFLRSAVFAILAPTAMIDVS
jgi:hypothetical protein